MQNTAISVKDNSRKNSVLSQNQLKKLWRGESKRAAIYQHSLEFCNTVEAFKLIGDHYYSGDWSGKEMILLSYSLSPPQRSKLFVENIFCPELAKNQKAYFDIFKVVAELCNREIRPYDSHVSAGAWNAIFDDHEQISTLLEKSQEKALHICDILAEWLRAGAVQSCYRISGTSQEKPILSEDWNIDSPLKVFRSLGFDSSIGLTSTKIADSFVFFNTKDIKLCLQEANKAIPNSGFSSSYQSEFMKAMDYLIDKAKISDSNQPTLKQLKPYAVEAMKFYNLEPSGIMVHKLSTFVRLKEKLKGGRPPV